MTSLYKTVNLPRNLKQMNELARIQKNSVDIVDCVYPMRFIFYGLLQLGWYVSGFYTENMRDHPTNGHGEKEKNLYTDGLFQFIFEHPDHENVTLKYTTLFNNVHPIAPVGFSADLCSVVTVKSHYESPCGMKAINEITSIANEIFHRCQFDDHNANRVGGGIVFKKYEKLWESEFNFEDLPFKKLFSKMKSTDETASETPKTES